MFRFSGAGVGDAGILLLFSLGICVFLLPSLVLFLFNRPGGIVSRNEEKKGDEGVVGRSEEETDSREPMPVFAELVDSDLLRFASHWLMAFGSLLERLGVLVVFEQVSMTCFVPGGKY